jgi:hypothetical protein
MEYTYKRFHGICGEAACVPFAAVVCAKVDLAGEVRMRAMPAQRLKLYALLRDLTRTTACAGDPHRK